MILRLSAGWHPTIVAAFLLATAVLRGMRSLEQGDAQDALNDLAAKFAAVRGRGGLSSDAAGGLQGSDGPIKLTGFLVSSNRAGA